MLISVNVSQYFPISTHCIHKRLLVISIFSISLYVSPFPFNKPSTNFYTLHNHPTIFFSFVYVSMYNPPYCLKFLTFVLSGHFIKDVQVNLEDSRVHQLFNNRMFHDTLTWQGYIYHDEPCLLLTFVYLDISLGEFLTAVTFLICLHRETSTTQTIVCPSTASFTAWMSRVRS